MKKKIQNDKIEKRRRERQRQICRGAMKIFRKKGFSATTMREIAEASQITLGNLYNYIDKKEDILFLIHNDVLDKISSLFNKIIKSYENPVEQLVNVVGKLFDLTCELKDEMLFIYTETKSLKRSQMYTVLQRESRFVSTFETIVAKVVKKRHIGFIEFDLLANIIVYALAIYPLRGWNITLKRSKEEMREALIKFILRGMGVSDKEINKYIH